MYFLAIGIIDRMVLKLAYKPWIHSFWLVIHIFVLKYFSYDLRLIYALFQLFIICSGIALALVTI